jgi:PAS domain S-box-containing protein
LFAIVIFLNSNTMVFAEQNIVFYSSGLTNRRVNFLNFMQSKSKTVFRSLPLAPGSWSYHTETGDLFLSDEIYRILELYPMESHSLPECINNLMDESEREKNKILLGQMIQQGRPFSYRQNLRFPDGRNKTIRISGSAIRNNSGMVEGLEGTCEDITDTGNSDLQRFFELSADLLCISDGEGKILSHSSSFEKLSSCSSDELQGVKLSELLKPEDEHLFNEQLKTLFENGKIGYQETVFFFPDKRRIHLQWTATYDAKSNRIFASAKDITKKSEFEALLLKGKIEAEKARTRDRFLANMSHEIRTPLNAIIGFNEILNKSGLNANQKKMVDIIRAASRTLSVIVNDILDLSKLDNGKLELDFKPFRLEQVCRQVIQLESAKARSKGIKLFFSYDNDIPESLLGDDIRLTQILINLVSNAIKFTEKGQVELKVWEAFRVGNTSQISFRISDSGIGIPKDKIRKIFRRFSQAESYTTRMYGGTGLGLSIVKSLIKLHNGKISVKSQEGVGSVFTFSIRYEISDAEPEPEASEDGFHSDSEIQDLQNLRILITDDNEHNQMLACSFLERYGMHTDVASNGRQALELLRQNKYDIVLMDLQMPTLDGLSTAELIRKELKLKVPVIACSAHAMASERRKCLESGMDDYISKPYSEATLVRAIRQFFQAKPVKEAESILVPAAISGNGWHSHTNGKQVMENHSGAKLEQSVRGRIPEDIRLIREALQQKNWEALEFKAHHLISSLSVLKMEEGIRLSRQLEHAAHDGKVSESMHLGRELLDFLESVSA